MTRDLIKYLSIIVIISACSMDKDGFNPASRQDQLLTEVKLEFNAYNLATDEPYNTVQLQATAISGTGKVLDHPVTYSVADPKLLEVSSDGVLKAIAPTTGTVVRVSMTYNGLTRTDSAFVAVTSGTPSAFPARVAIELNEGDSAKAAAPGLGGATSKSIRLIRADSSGNNMSALRVAVSSADTATAKITQSSNNVAVNPVRPGRTTLYVSTYAYGIALRDSLSFLVGWPVDAWINVYARFPTGMATPILDFYSKRFTLGTGACVAWINHTEMDVAIEFEEPELVGPANRDLCVIIAAMTGDTGGGNIDAFRTEIKEDGSFDAFQRMRSRAFNTPGVYRYHSRLYGTYGEIIICDEQNDSTCSPENYRWGAID